MSGIMATDTMITLRLDGTTVARLDDAAGKVGLARATLVKLAVDGLIDAIEKKGGILILPIRVIGKDDLPWVEQQREAFEKKMREQNT